MRLGQVGGNYAPTIAPMKQAAERHGCQQVLYTLKRGDKCLLSEAGAMNIFFFLEKPAGGFELVRKLAANTPSVAVAEREYLQQAFASFE